MLIKVDCIVMVFFSGLSFLIFSVLVAKRFAGKNICDVTYLVSSGTLNLNSVNPESSVPEQVKEKTERNWLNELYLEAGA